MYLVTTVLKVDDVFAQRHVDLEMVRRLFAERLRKGVVVETVFRGAVVMNIVEVVNNVTEIVI